ncbi:MAG: AMP-binding protein, partial [Myxococcota bacterium]
MNTGGERWTRFYDSWVNPDEPVPRTTFAAALERTFEEFPKSPAWYFLGTRATYGDLDALSGRFAAFLASAGIKKGDVIGICLPNIPQYMIAFAAAVRMGCICTGVSPLLTASELVHQLVDSGARALVIMDSLFEQKLMKVSDQLPALGVVVAANVGDFLPVYKRALGRLFKKIPSGRVAPIPGKVVRRFMECLQGGRPEFKTADIAPDDVCVIQYTGGTTGLPKGAELTNRSLVSNVTFSTIWLKMERGTETICSAFPFFHLAGLIFAMGVLITG